MERANQEVSQLENDIAGRVTQMNFHYAQGDNLNVAIQQLQVRLADCKQRSTQLLTEFKAAEAKV